jgi:dTDP-4-amino-4,6-dideoxygalactose transaminase
MKVKFVDLPRQNKILKAEFMATLRSVIDEADFNMGPRLQKFEKNFADFCGKKYAVGVNSGTDALLLSLLAYGIGRGDEVIIPANGYISLAMVISNIGAIPVFVDIESESYTMDVKKIEKAITKKTRAIVPVHMYGQPADMDTILKIAKKDNIIVIEDACQAHGAKYKNKTLPYSETGAFSFFPGKNLGSFGDGGAVVTDNKAIYEKILYLRNDGSREKYVHEMLGLKSRLDTLQAAILSVKLPHLEKWNEQRKNHARLYTEYLANIEGIQIPKQQTYADHVFHAYVIEYDDRDKLQQYLNEQGIETIIHYPTPIHLQKPYLEKGYKRGDFPVSEMKSKTILSLPMFPELQIEEINYICNTIKKFVTRK